MGWVMEKQYDKIIIGAGLYGLYSAISCGTRKQRVLVLECDDSAFGRATYVNQARVHQGYHYPRSVSTAAKSAGYFERFNKDYSFCINKSFKQIYATSSDFSWTSGDQFKDFCGAVGIPCEELNPNQFFKQGMCDAAFLTREYTYDAAILRRFFLEKIAELSCVTIQYGTVINEIERRGGNYAIKTNYGEVEAPFVLNASYASANQILTMAGFMPFNIKYELCEITLCSAGEKLSEYGFTVMDGPFFSIMPFGETGFHSLTSVTFTPHSTCYETVPSFECQSRSNGFCTPARLGNCNLCPAKPQSAFPYMSSLARKYLRDEFEFQYDQSLYSLKPILKASEIDDSRPTVIKVLSEKPSFVSVLSGKINTIYDLDEVLTNE